MGKPACRHGHAQLTEFIGKLRQTRGTETSKYPEEKKTTVIPSVAASERGEAQTKEHALWGCGTLHMESEKSKLGEAVWKGPP